MTTTARPFSKVNCARPGAAVVRAAGASRAAHRQAVRALRIRNLGKAVPAMPAVADVRPLRATARESIPSNRTVKDGGNLPAVALLAGAIGRGSRRRLVAWRRLRQRTARRFAGEGRRLSAIAAHQPVQAEDTALFAEFARGQLAANILLLDRSRSLRGIGHPPGPRGLAAAQFVRRQGRFG